MDDDGKRRLFMADGGCDQIQFPTFICPGCHYTHSFRVGIPDDLPVWDWNRSVSRPTFSPCFITRNPNGSICAFSVTDGLISFASGCSHELDGQVVALPEVDSSHIAVRLMTGETDASR
jgi:hypothetical protein